MYNVVPGIIRTKVGYCDGTTKDPTYLDLGDYTEAVQLQFDPKTITYSQVLEHFWNGHNSAGKQVKQYQSAIYYHSEEQRKTAEESMKTKQATLKKPIQTKIIPYTVFVLAENYHQKYLLREQRHLFDSLHLSDEQVISTHLASVLNGYIGGCGELDSFERDWKKFGLNERQAAFVKKSFKTMQDPAQVDKIKEYFFCRLSLEDPS